MILFSLHNINYKNVVSYEDFEIKVGRTTFITGKSGSGKTTLLKLLNNAISPTEGQVLCHSNFNEKAVEDSSDNNLVPIESFDSIFLRRNILLVSQSVFLFDSSIRSNFEQFYTFRELPPPKDNIIQSYLDICDASFSLDLNCNEMSGGERQRVFIAICLSLMPKVLMLDEPTSALDDVSANNLLTNIKKFCKENNITLLVICHNHELVEKYADEIVEIKKAKNE